MKLTTKQPILLFSITFASFILLLVIGLIVPWIITGEPLSFTSSVINTFDDPVEKNLLLSSQDQTIDLDGRYEVTINDSSQITSKIELGEWGLDEGEYEISLSKVQSLGLVNLVSDNEITSNLTIDTSAPDVDSNVIIRTLNKWDINHEIQSADVAYAQLGPKRFTPNELGIVTVELDSIPTGVNTFDLEVFDSAGNSTIQQIQVEIEENPFFSRFDCDGLSVVYDETTLTREYDTIRYGNVEDFYRYGIQGFLDTVGSEVDYSEKGCYSTAINLEGVAFDPFNGEAHPDAYIAYGRFTEIQYKSMFEQNPDDCTRLDI